ncbi:MAG: (Fe-S)-binding protein [Chloroflexi bacterium]|nr:(Fe-S)-binding protein [Chloroflexota bacterium]
METLAKPKVSARSGNRYAEYFQEIDVLQRLQLLPQERAWMTLPPTNPQPHPVVLYLGCNVFRTAHLVQTVVDIFHLLGVDFVAVGGPAYCCGVVHHRGGDLDMAQNLGWKALEYFRRFHPERVVMWCPSCLAYYDEVMEVRDQFEFRVQHTTEFLLEHLGRLRFSYAVPRRVALHHHTGKPQRDLEAACAKEILRAIPGLDLVEIGSDPRLGRICAEYVQQEIGQETWQGLIRSQTEQASAQGAEIFSTLYHGCQRLLCPYEGRSPFAVENYITLVGQALGIHHEDKFKKYVQWGDEARILADAAPCLRGNGIPLKKAQWAIARNFGGR